MENTVIENNKEQFSTYIEIENNYKNEINKEITDYFEQYYNKNYKK